MCNSKFRGANVLFWPPGTPGTRVECTYMWGSKYFYTHNFLKTHHLKYMLACLIFILTNNCFQIKITAFKKLQPRITFWAMVSICSLSRI